MAAGVAWVLNLDADVELATSTLGVERKTPTHYTPKRSLLAAMQPHIDRLRSSLLRPSDLLIDDTSPESCAQGRVGRAFCPTARALRLLERSGAAPEPHPPVSTIRRVNSRAFASAMGATLVGASFVTDESAAKNKLAESPPVGDAWRVKRAFGMSGRGQRVVRSTRDLDESTVAFLRAGLREGGVQIEPDVHIESEYALHGVVTSSGSLTLGSLVSQRCDGRGAWLETERVTDFSEARSIGVRLAEEVRFVAENLHAAGYFGPFGVDAYTYRDDAGRVQLQPRSEINARYSMGFAIGFGRPED